jgi:hypothetical protein
MYIITYSVNLENQKNSDYEIRIRVPIEMTDFF